MAGGFMARGSRRPSELDRSSFEPPSVDRSRSASGGSGGEKKWTNGLCRPDPSSFPAQLGVV